MYTFHPGDYGGYAGDLRESFPAWLRGRSCSQVWILADENTRRHCLPLFALKTGLPADTNIIEIPAGESHKNLDTCAQIWRAMLDARLDRNALVVNLGGGVTGDIGGFCAATWKRGVDFVQVPTTLLSMTDAAIGGKLGIDFQGVKNTIGVFKNPAAVFVDPVFLQTLPERELRSGLAEVIKHALIGDPALWRRIQSDGVTWSHPVTHDYWIDALRASIAVKVRVVQEDPFEKGLRAILNFGHTVGHALESYYLDTADPLTHGEAVAIGMICETALSGEKTQEIASVIMRHFPHRPVPAAAFPALWDLMQQDKKNALGKVRMALPGPEPFTMRVLEPEREAVERSLEYYNGLENRR